MSNYLNEAGPLIWAVIALGVVALAAAIVYGLQRQRRHASLALGASVISIITGLLATVVGFQKSVGGLGQVAAENRWIYLVGLQESLNNLVVALVFAWLVSLLLMFGAWRESPGAAH